MMVQKDIQQAVEQVLVIEREANAIVRRGVEEAKAVRVRSAQAANAVREEVVAKARREADELIASTIARAELERDQRLAEKMAEIEALERSAQHSRRAAVRFVVASLLGESAGEATRPPADERRIA